MLCVPACAYYFLIDVHTCKNLTEIKENRKQPIHPLVDLQIIIVRQCKHDEQNEC